MRPTIVAIVAVGVLAAPGTGLPATHASTPESAFVLRLKAAVRRSRAEIRVLTLRQQKLRLDVVARDPAAYLEHRYGPVIEVVNNRHIKLDRIFLQVVDGRSRRVVFSLVAEAPALNGTTSWITSWKVYPPLLDCARTLPLGLEIDIERQAPACPA
jgi:hypothetical protein